MALINNAGITFSQLKDKYQQFRIKEIPVNNKIVTKSEIIEYISCDESKLTSYTNNQAVWYRDIVGVIRAGFNGKVNKVQVLSDGRILVCGKFTSYYGVNCGTITRLLSNGELDTSFSVTGLFTDNPEAYDFIVVGTSYIYVGFKDVGLKRFTYAFGLVDNSAFPFDPNLFGGFPYSCFKVRSLTNGQLLAILGTDTSRRNGKIYKLNSNNSVDTSFSQLPIDVICFDFDSSMNIYAGGVFNNFGNYKYLIKLNSNGTVNTSFNYSNYLDNTVSVIKILSNGQILVGGSFNYYGSTLSRKIAKFNNNGTIDTGFISNGGFNNGSSVYDIQQSGSYVFISGTFKTYSKGTTTYTMNSVMKFDLNGNVKTDFNPADRLSTEYAVRSIDVSTSNVFIGGEFTHYSNYLINRIGKLTSTGAFDTSFKHEVQ